MNKPTIKSANLLSELLKGTHSGKHETGGLNGFK